MTRLTGATVCSGIGGAELAGKDIDWQWCAEILKFQSALLAERFEHPNRGDITKYEEWPNGKIDLLCGGTPCQSFSQAGTGTALQSGTRKAGMDDERGKLALAFSAIVGKYQPRWIVWENVVGALQTNGGRDFGAFIRDLERRGYSLAWRVLDTAYVKSRSFPYGLPQRRPRVYLVGYFGADWRRAAEVLFGHSALQTHFATGRRSRTASGWFENRIGTEFGKPELDQPVPPVAKTLLTKPLWDWERVDNYVYPDGRVRILTPIEYERLQGFPDNWTLVRKNEKRDYYSAYKRYHGVGNSWSVNVAEYVLDRIKAVDQLPDLVA